MKAVAQCEHCGRRNDLLVCSRCKNVYYCCKEHQTKDWKNHKTFCFGVKSPVTSLHENTGHVSTTTDHMTDDDLTTTRTFTSEGSSEQEIINSRTEVLNPNFDFTRYLETFPISCDFNMLADDKVKDSRYNNFNQLPDFSLNKTNSDSFSQGNEVEFEDICRTIISDMDSFGVCVVDNFLGDERGKTVLEEVKAMYQTGLFRDGQLVSNSVKRDRKTIRSDQITWTDGKEGSCRNIGFLISKVDWIIMKTNSMANNGKMGLYTIKGRTKAMVACYPGDGAHYVKHVDNPNKDGRCITAIYYLNLDWDVRRSGGMLRIFPEGQDKVANIEPKFDRILFFWSDKRNPHEVQPAFKTRYAVTIWYFDADERESSLRTHEL